MSKKFLTKLLALTMCAGLILQPVTAYADTPATGEGVEETAVEEVSEEVPEVVPDVAPEEILEIEEKKTDLLSAPIVGAAITESNVDIKPMEEDNLIELLPLTNVKIENGILTLDPYAEGCLYRIEIAGSDDSMVFESEEINLAEAFVAFEIAPGSYTLILTAVNYVGSGYETISLPYEFTYEYNVEPDPEPDPGPLPKIIYFSEDYVSSSDIDSVPGYGKECVSPTFSSENPGIEYTFEGWQMQSKDLVNSPMHDGWIPVSSFLEGHYRAVLSVSISDEYPNHAFNPDFKLFVNGEAWNLIPANVIPDNSDITSLIFVSNEYIVNYEEPQKTAISEVLVNTDTGLTFTIVDYGFTKADAFRADTVGVKADFIKWLQKTDDGNWEDYNEERFNVGYYKAQFSIEIESEYADQYEFDENVKCYYDLNRECEFVSKENTPDGTKLIFNTPDYYSKYSDGRHVSRIRVYDGIIYYDPFRGASKYEIKIQGDSYYTEETSFNAIKVFYEKELPFGSYMVSIRAVDADLWPMTDETSLYYTYNNLPPEGKKKITTIETTSDIAEIFVDGEKYKDPTFIGPAAIKFVNINWLKFLHEQYIPVRSDDKDYFSEGQYRYEVLVYIDSKYQYTHELSEEIKLFVDGKEWSIDEKMPNGSSRYFLSPVFTIGDEPIDPEEPKGTWKTKWGATYYETEDGEKLTGVQKIGEDYYLFSDRGTLQSNVFHEENGKTYYFGKDGKRVTGWKDKWSATYYFDENGVMATGFTDIEGNTYYFKADGRLTKSTWITVGTDKYYTKSDGKLAKSETILKWGKRYTFDENGVLVK